MHPARPSRRTAACARACSCLLPRCLHAVPCPLGGVLCCCLRLCMVLCSRPRCRAPLLHPPFRESTTTGRRPRLPRDSGPPRARARHRCQQRMLRAAHTLLPYHPPACGALPTRLRGLLLLLHTLSMHCAPWHAAAPHHMRLLAPGAASRGRLSRTRRVFICSAAGGGGRAAASPEASRCPALALLPAGWLDLLAWRLLVAAWRGAWRGCFAGVACAACKASRLSSSPISTPSSGGGGSSGAVGVRSARLFCAVGCAARSAWAAARALRLRLCVKSRSKFTKEGRGVLAAQMQRPRARARARERAGERTRG